MDVGADYSNELYKGNASECTYEHVYIFSISMYVFYSQVLFIALDKVFLIL